MELPPDWGVQKPDELEGEKRGERTLRNRAKIPQRKFYSPQKERATSEDDSSSEEDEEEEEEEEVS